MDEEDRQELRATVEDAVGGARDEDGWARVDRALALVDESLRGGTGDWRRGRNALFAELHGRALRGLHHSLPEPDAKPAPPPTRELANRLLHRLGLPPAPPPPPPSPSPAADDAA
ncbi:hypothetical protein WEI85_14020 [Actinomycetes bacterium KLBMP 9797]